MKRRNVASLLVLACVMTLSPGTWAVPTALTTHGAGSTDLAGSLAASDLLSGLIGTELAGDNGWHPANPAASNSLLPEGLPAFTDDVNNTGLFGLLNDFPGEGVPTKRVQYDLSTATDIAEIQILTGNDGADGRVFSTTVISTSTNGGASFSQLGYFQSDPSGTINSGQWRSTLIEITDDAGGPLATDVTNLIFEFYAVDNTGGQNRDPFNGVNPFTGIDDTLTFAFVSPLVWEIDVLAVRSNPADFNDDGLIDCQDVDSLVMEIVAGTNGAVFDLTGDSIVNTNDLDEWRVQAGAANLPSHNPYLPGDANLNGAVDGSDFGAWNANKFTSVAAWCSGDFNADGNVDGSDFGIWNANKFMSADSVASIPEPGTVGLLLLTWLLAVHHRQRVSPRPQ